MIFRTFSACIVVLLASLSIAQAQGEFFPVDALKRGQKGIGKTIFSGSSIEEFDVEILGVLDNFGPQQRLILARLSGEKVERTGVFQGMSGSPVYIDGKLLGAVSFSFPFSKEPLAGITPIGEMVEIFKGRPQREARRRAQALDLHSLQRIPDAFDDPVSALKASYGPQYAVQQGQFGAHSAGLIRPIATPLSLSGFTSRTLNHFAPSFQALGWSPVRGLAGTGSEDAPLEPLMPGSTVTVQMVRGDMEVSASGTLTLISGDKVYAFGHPFLGLGDTDMPLSQGSVIEVIPSLMSSQKVSTSHKFIGSIRQDRSTGIYGIRGAVPKMVPVHLQLITSRNEVKDFNYEIVNDEFLTPFMINLTVNNALLASEKTLGGQTLRLRCDIGLQGQPNVIYESNVASFTSGPALAAVTLSGPVSLLLAGGFDDLEIERIEFKIEAVEESRQAELFKVWQDKLEVKAGDDLNLTLFLRRENGETEVERHSVRIPKAVTPGPLSIAVGDGFSFARVRAEGQGKYVPENLGQLVKAINQLKKNDRLYIRLFREKSGAVVRGEGMPALPPSILALYRSRKSSGDVESINRVVYQERELPSKDFALTGHQLLEIQVID